LLNEEEEEENEDISNLYLEEGESGVLMWNYYKATKLI
jgi:hypothetical protein